MSIECYRSKGRNTYYSEGKRISKKVASTLSPKLPKCVPKTKSNEIKNLKKQLKEVMTHREQYKTTSSDLDSRLKSCSIVREEYDRLVDMIKSATSSVDVMGRVCLTQDLKEKIDREYKELRETLESTTRSYDEKVEKLVSVVDKNKVDIEAYQTEVISLNNENKGLRDALNDNSNVIDGLKEQLDRLQEERLNLIEEVNLREKKIDDKNDEIVQRMEVIGRLDGENTELKNNIKKMASDYSKLNSYYEKLNEDHEELKEKAKGIYSELQISENANEVLRQRYDDAEQTIKEYTEDMSKADEEIRVIEEENFVLRKKMGELENYFKEVIDRYKDNIGMLETKNNALSVRVTSLNEDNEKLNQSLENEVEKMRRFEEINLNVISILEKKINKLEEDKKILKDNFDEMVELSDRLDRSLGSAIEKTSECFAENKELSETFSNEKFNLESSFFNIQEDNKRMRDLLENCKDDKDILKMQEEQIERLTREAEALRDEVKREKDECISRIQQRIEETEGVISSRETKKYEKELEGLNNKLKLAEEALNELKKAGTLEGKKMPAKSVKKAIKKINQATVGPQRQIMERVRY
jgi:chromosome segregation ATPase